jgi:hypothetical protein
LYRRYGEEAAGIFRRHMEKCLLCRSDDGGRFEAAEAARLRRGQQAEVGRYKLNPNPVGP